MVVRRSKCGDDDDDDFEVPPTVIQKKKVPKKKSESSVASPSKLNIVHGVQERENYMKQYRSNIVSLINIMQDTRFTKRHITALERTPFGMLFKCFWKKDDVVLKKFKKVGDNVMDVIKSYDFHAKGFKLGGKTCDIRDSDVTLIFGIKSGMKKVDVTYGKKQESPFVQRRFRNMSRISVKSLREALGDALEGTTRVDVEDVARIMCLFVVATLLLPTTGLTVGWAFVALVKDLEMMNSYAWSTAIASTLTTSIHSSLRSSENVTGCVLLLLVILVMRAYYPHSTSRKKFVSKAPSMGLINIEEKANEEVIANTKARRGVNHNELKPISREEMALICNDDEEDALEIEENLETEEDALDMEENLETKEDALDMEENLETEEDEDHVAEALGDDQPLKDFINLQKENRRLKSENMALVEELKKMREIMQKIEDDQEAKTKETMEKMSNTEKEMEKLRKEIEVLESENKQLVEQIEENAVHAATQGFASKEMPHAEGVEQEQNIGIQSTLKESPIVVEPLQTSMVRKIKIKARKKKEMFDFECEPREAKKKKTTKQAIEVMLKEVICVDNLSLSQAKPVERVLFPNKAAICKLLDENDKCLLNKIYNLETTDAIIWSGTGNGVYVTLHDVDAILRDGDTANNVIDSFIEMLEIEQQVKKPEKNKSFFFSSLCWFL
ncbi:unnamed protein product [Camellia sinensis]